ncbi:MAG: Fpg/Nei family DNA glycosylase, partial [Anaerolineae bacterium]|nr:Fpg/Nei family DNA glycosylase [Anaerolineae bacterium]
MPELPDIVVLARSMDEALRGKIVAGVEVNQPKCLNIAPEAFAEQVAGCRLEGFRQRGKWVLGELDNGATLALNLGMGGEMILHKPGETPDPTRERVVFRFTDATQLWIHHWWFGHVHLIEPGKLGEHPAGETGPEPLADDFTAAKLGEMLAGKRGRLKNYLLDQKFIAGIGNVYIQDILWRARLHPMRKAGALDVADIERLHGAIRGVLNEGIKWGGGPGEKDIYGNV